VLYYVFRQSGFMLKNRLHLHTLFVLFSLKSKGCYIKVFCCLHCLNIHQQLVVLVGIVKVVT
jgi:hypothetical protein